jgi:hypothetical protein
LLDEQNDPKLQDEINEVISTIEDYEDLLDNINNLDSIVPDSLIDYTISLGGFNFKYDAESGIFKYHLNKLETAKTKVFTNHGLIKHWRSNTKLKNRIAGILTTLEESSFEELVKIVRSKIDFNEFLGNTTL